MTEYETKESDSSLKFYKSVFSIQFLLHLLVLKFKVKQSCINVRSNDQRCSKTSTVKLALYPESKDPRRVSKYKKIGLEIDV